MITELVVYMYGYDYESLSLTTIPVPAFKLQKYCQKNDGQLRPFSYNHRDPNGKQPKRDLYKKLPIYLQSFGRQEYLGVGYKYM